MWFQSRLNLKCIRMQVCAPQKLKPPNIWEPPPSPVSAHGLPGDGLKEEAAKYAAPMLALEGAL